METSMKLTQLLEFHQAFPGEEMLTVDDYLKGASKDLVLKLALFFLNGQPHKNTKEFIESYFSYDNHSTATEIYTNILEAEMEVHNISILSVYSSLRLFEHFYSKPEEGNYQTQSELEVNLFKAYLCFNSEYAKIQGHDLNFSEEVKGEDKVAYLIFEKSYPVSDKENYNINIIWISQLVKAIYFLEYFASENIHKKLYESFLEYYGCESWQEYFKRLVPLTLPAINTTLKSYTDIEVPKDEHYEDNCKFIEKFIVEPDDSSKNDFLHLRAKPFYKLSEGVYRIIFNLFVVEKIYKGLYFQLRDINDKLEKKDRVSNLRSIYGEYFSERILLYKVMEIIYPNLSHKYSGEEILNKHDMEAEPDYYLRNNNNILIFESKDFLIDANSKFTFDFNVYEEKFKQRHYYTTDEKGKDHPKTVLQLIENVRKILYTQLPFDKGYQYRKVKVFPILITHDHQYDVPGFNELIDSWFQIELNKLQKDGGFTLNVQQLIVVNIDCLIYYQNNFINDIPLDRMLELYIDYKKSIKIDPKMILDGVPINQLFNIYSEKHIPFSLFIEKYFDKYKYTHPKMLEEMLPQIINH